MLKNYRILVNQLYYKGKRYKKDDVLNLNADAATTKSDVSANLLELIEDKKPELIIEAKDLKAAEYDQTQLIAEDVNKNDTPKTKKRRTYRRKKETSGTNESKVSSKDAS